MVAIARGMVRSSRAGAVGAAEAVVTVVTAGSGVGRTAGAIVAAAGGGASVTR